MHRPLRFTASFNRPSDATAYAAGDEVSNHATAGSVVRPTFDLTGLGEARLNRLALDITPASDSLVITNLDLEVLLFKTPDAPDAVGDNVTHPIPAATLAKAVATFRFDAAMWRNQLGALTAGTSGFQQTVPVIALPLSTADYAADQGQLEFGGSALTARELTAVTRVLGAWNPGAVVNAFGLTLEIETP